MGGRAGLRLIWENSQHPQMPCVISTRNGWILGEKNSEKCSLCLIMFRSNWTEISWNVLISGLGCSVRTKETIANAAEQPKHRVIREFGVLLAVWLFCRALGPGRKLWTENASLLQKPPMASPRSSDDGEKVPDSRHLPFTY